MKALIMAAGYGRRLEPLTLAVPKPMVPIANLPIMQNNLLLLKKYGFTQAIANIHYHPEQIEHYFKEGNDFGMDISYSYEEKLLGTAGGVKKMAGILRVKDTFLVLSSDTLTDINLSKLVAYHKKKKALVTVALAEVEEVSQFGVVVLDAKMKITGFQEKPSPEEAKSHLVNAGIYVMEPEVLKMVPGGFYDFGKELFPRLVKQQAPLYGYKMECFWSDIGNLEKYVQANWQVMEGMIKLNLPGKKQRTKIDPSVKLTGKVMLGEACKIGEKVEISNSMIGGKCVIMPGAKIKNSILWNNVVVGERAQVDSAIIGSWVGLGAKIKIAKNSVIANRCTVRKGISLPANTRLRPNAVV